MKDLYKNKLESLYLAGEREIPRPKSPMGVDPASSKTSHETKERTDGLQGDPTGLLKDLREEIGDCQRCRLCQKRTHIVFGVGNPSTDLMFVGEAPGRDEDLKGEPFVGRAGQLLTRIIEAMKLKRSEVYIANVLKCRPPENRNPAPDEIQTCEPFLLKQVEIIQPKIIVCLGTFATQTLLQTDTKIGGLRGRFQAWPSAIVKASFETTLLEASIKVMPTYHPAFLLRNSNMKRPVWEDMQKVMEELQKSS